MGEHREEAATLAPAQWGDKNSVDISDCLRRLIAPLLLRKKPVDFLSMVNISSGDDEDDDDDNEDGHE
ncbi:hypothetical protein M0804_003893 [Polistes exclamans]|nr:hypothetical protein M0804_003893 [Polistes exclamans]